MWMSRENCTYEVVESFTTSCDPPETLQKGTKLTVVQENLDRGLWLVDSKALKCRQWLRACQFPKLKLLNPSHGNQAETLSQSLRKKRHAEKYRRDIETLMFQDVVVGKHYKIHPSRQYVAAAFKANDIIVHDIAVNGKTGKVLLKNNESKRIHLQVEREEFICSGRHSLTWFCRNRRPHYE